MLYNHFPIQKLGKVKVQHQTKLISSYILIQLLAHEQKKNSNQTCTLNEVKSRQYFCFRLENLFSVCGVMFNSFLFQLPYTFDFLFISILCACATGKRTPCYNVNAFNRIHRSNAFLTFCHFLCRNFM